MENDKLEHLKAVKAEFDKLPPVPCWCDHLGSHPFEGFGHYYEPDLTTEGELRRLRVTTAKLEQVILDASGELMDHCHGDHEHQIECHADTLPEMYRALSLASQKAYRLLQDIVNEMVDPTPTPKEGTVPGE